MKKFFSLLALVGVLAACQKEDLKTAFKVDPGVATVHATALSIVGEDITAYVTFSFNGQAGSTSQTFYSTEYEAFDQEVSVSATWAGHDGTKSFSDEKKVRVHVLPGGKAEYNVVLTLGEIIDGDYSYFVHDDIDYDEFTTEFFYLAQSHNQAPTHSAPLLYHDGKEYDATYLMNPSEFILRGTLNYTTKEGRVPNTPIMWNSGVEPITYMADYVDSAFADGITYTDASLDFTVSGFAMYCAYHAVYSSVGKLSLVRINKSLEKEGTVIATCLYTEYWGNEAGVIEDACVGHEAHYVPGHGHEDHGHSHGHGNSNAGGGIVYAD